MCLTRQEIFDKAVNGLASQGFRQCLSCFNEDCQYANDEGMHCAVGWLDTTLTGSLSVLIVYRERMGIITDIIHLADLTFVKELQRQHDLNNTPEAMVVSLARFADKNGLTKPESLKL